MDHESPDLRALRQKLDDEEAAYASLLAALDRLAAFPLPLETLKEQPAQMKRLNALWEAPPAPEVRGLAGRSARKAWDALAPARERQVEFNSALVQVLNGHLDETARLHSRLRELAVGEHAAIAADARVGMNHDQRVDRVLRPDLGRPAALGAVADQRQRGNLADPHGSEGGCQGCGHGVARRSCARCARRASTIAS